MLAMTTTTTTETVVRRELAVEKPASGIEVDDQREENINVLGGTISYLVSRPIPEGMALKKVAITVFSKDHGCKTTTARTVTAGLSSSC